MMYVSVCMYACVYVYIYIYICLVSLACDIFVMLLWT